MAAHTHAPEVRVEDRLQVDLGCGEGVVREIGQPYEATCPSTSSRTRGYKPPRGKASHHYLLDGQYSGDWRTDHAQSTNSASCSMYVMHPRMASPAAQTTETLGTGGLRTLQEAFATVARGGVAAEGP